MIRQRVLAKYPIKIGKTLINKNTEGEIYSIEESLRMQETFPNLKHQPDGNYLIVKFPDAPECLCSKEQLIYEFN